jgi:DNA-binding transcriptional regulator YiaG
MTAKQLKAMRDRLGESQEAFARRFGVARTTLLRWETDGPPTFGPTSAHIASVLADLSIKLAQAAE